ncbi:outer membrane lipoprotein-sorting protein [Flagellimonas aquimarina]|uniref:Outer membrane lipoprotein-sorting protein n=1 Tax=Flagellimonas aquimarina TaxID=2201895 RepID=A0A316L1T5_9FLAO|nr:outer membrane lipoprotein-sorting protein [Allomuricauda koreensis]PWL38955.1 outer membrane lipoprotein-sorting protein [Allomuricauda koreensis]
MKTFKTTILLFFAMALSVQAQTADEIIANYFENTGGLENWTNLEGVKTSGVGIQQGFEFPIGAIQLKDGRQLFSANIQGKEFKQQVYDGEVLWSTNFMTMKAEKSDAEQTENFKLNTNDFPDPFIDYKAKGYTVELLGKETVDGAETFKIKLVKEPIMVDGTQEDDISFYYFDTENFVPIAVETKITSGQGKGKTARSVMSDYQEIDGLYFPHSTSQYIDGAVVFSMNMESFELNPEVEENTFSFPEEMTEEKK